MRRWGEGGRGGGKEGEEGKDAPPPATCLVEKGIIALLHGKNEPLSFAKVKLCFVWQAGTLWRTAGPTVV